MKTRFIGVMIDLAGTAMFLYFYFSPRNHRFHKNKWILLACLAWIGLAVSDLHSVMKGERSGFGRPTSKAPLHFREEGPVATSQLLYHAPEGYTISIPAGYRYTNERQGPVSFFAVKKDGATGKRLISVARLPISGDLHKAAEKTADGIKAKHEEMKWKVTSEDGGVFLFFSLPVVNGTKEGVMRFVRAPQGVYVVGAIDRHHSKAAGQALAPELEEAVRSFRPPADDGQRDSEK